MNTFCKRGRSRQIFAGFTGGLCLLIAGNWAGWASPFLHKLKKGEIPFNLTTTEISWVVSLLDIGNIISPIPAGYLMDYFGRKSLFFLTAIINQLAWFFAIAANGANMLYVARFLCGLGKGLTFTVCPMYLAEIAETEIRGAISGLFGVLLCIGTLFEFTMGIFVPMQTINIVCSILPLIFFLFVTMIPESPYYYLMKNQHNKAYKSYSWLRNPENNGTKKERIESLEKELESMNTQVEKEMESQQGWKDLICTKGTRRATLIVMTLSALQRFGGINIMLQYMSTTLPNSGSSLGPDVCMIIFSLLLLSTGLISIFIVDWLGRKPTLLVSGIVCSIDQGIMAFYFYLDNSSEIDMTYLYWVPYACMLIFPVFFQVGLGVMPHTLLGEMFPANVKGKAAAVATICFAASAFILNKIYPIIKRLYGEQFMFILFSISNLMAAVFTYFFVIETKGKTFGEIQEILNK